MCFFPGQSQLIAPSQPIVATVGDDIILPCHLKPEADVVAMTLEWTRPDLNDIFVHVRRASQDIVRVQHPSFTGRTSVSIDELKHGNVSLKLSKVKPSDAGRYQCYIPKLNTGSVVELIVGAASSLVISLSGLDRNKGAVVLQCESTGWYPEPEVFWLDGEGNLLSAGPTETVRGPDDLYTVSSRVTVEKRHSNSFTCRVQQNHTNQTREAQIHVPGDFFPVQSSSSSTIAGLVVSLAVCILVILILGFYVWRQEKTKTKRIHRDETGEGEMNQEGEGLVTKSKFKEEKQQKLKEEQQKLKEEQQSREEAENRVQILEEELQKKNRELQEEKKKREEEVQRKNQELQEKTDQMEGSKDEAIKKLLQETQEKDKVQSVVKMLKDQLESKNKEVEHHKDKVNDLTEEKKRSEKERQELQTKLKELEQKLQDEKKKSEEAQRELNDQREKKLQEEQMEREEPVETFKTDDKTEVEHLSADVETEEKLNLQTEPDNINREDQ
ncbi:CD276 antigen homolog [Acanthopagrus schlegelii]